MDLYNLLANASESKALRNIVDALSQVGLSSADLSMILDAVEAFPTEFAADIYAINEDSPHLSFKAVHIHIIIHFVMLPCHHAGEGS